MASPPGGEANQLLWYVVPAGFTARAMLTACQIREGMRRLPDS